MFALRLPSTTPNLVVEHTVRPKKNPTLFSATSETLEHPPVMKQHTKFPKKIEGGKVGAGSKGQL